MGSTDYTKTLHSVESKLYDLVIQSSVIYILEKTVPVEPLSGAGGRV